jgi:hypothetical protein
MDEVDLFDVFFLFSSAIFQQASPRCTRPPEIAHEMPLGDFQGVQTFLIPFLPCTSFAIHERSKGECNDRFLHTSAANDAGLKDIQLEPSTSVERREEGEKEV